MNSNPYVRSLIDPFDTAISQPKILDGSVDRSCGIKLKATGTFNLDSSGADTYFILYPGYSYCANWKQASTGTSLPNIFPAHLGDITNRANVKSVRIVSCGCKLSLENASLENEGFWEAVRIPLNPLGDFILVDQTSPNGEDYGVRPYNAFAIADMSNYTSYQSGRLKDLERFLFKLNSVAPDHPFTRVLPPSVAPVDARDVLDDFFDVVVIKMKGRVDAVTPSTIRYQIVSNQEVVYTENTSLSRLMITNQMVPEMPSILNATRFQLPAIQIA